MRIKSNLWTGVERICWLCVLMEEFIGINSLENIPLLMSGMASIYNAPRLQTARQALFNIRQMSLAYVTRPSLIHGVAIYNDEHYRNGTEGVYRINLETLAFERTDPLEDPSISEARQILSQPLRQQEYSIRVANPSQPMVVSLGEATTAVRIPIGPITAPLAPRRTHSLNRLPRGSIQVSLSELYDLAVEMDIREANYPERRRENWAGRFERFALMVPEADVGLREDDKIELEAIKHLIGLPGAGKTTLLILLAVWLGRNGYKAMFVFPSIAVARQYMAKLAFHNIRVGMLVGQSDETRRRHADNIAEAIAASGGNGGFAQTLEQAETFSLNCVLPAFSNADSSIWGFGYAPCGQILQMDEKKEEMRNFLCPVWTMCGRNKAPRDLIDADIWVGHILSMDTKVSPHAIDEQVRYFELIARTFDVVVFDEADMVQSVLDDYGAATLKLSGAVNSIHLVIQEQIHNRFARGENYRLFDRAVELYSRDLAEFGNHNTSLVTTVQNLQNSSRVGKRYENQLLSVFRIICDLLDGLGITSRREKLNEQQFQRETQRNRALKEFWETAAYHAFYDRTGIEPHNRLNVELCAQRLELERDILRDKWEKLIRYFSRYLAENLIQRRDKIVEEIAELFLSVCFPCSKYPGEAESVIKLLICITFVILGYQRIVPGTRTMVAEGLIREPIVESTASPEMRKVISESLLGSFSGVKYSFRTAKTTRTQAQNVELSYIRFVGAPRLLMYRFQNLFEADGSSSRPAILMTSATSFLEASPAYHISSGPDYLLKPRTTTGEQNQSVYYFKWLTDSEQGDKPLRYSGAGDLRDRNLIKMVDVLIKGGIKKSEVYKSMRNFDEQHGIYRKAAFVVNSYEQARDIKKHLNDYYPEVGKKTKAIVRALKHGEKATDFVTTSQCEALGDDETCDLIIFPMLAIGRGVNIVFTKGERKLDAAIGSIYFLTRPHPTTDDMQLLYSLAGKATLEFDRQIFTEADDLSEISDAFERSKKELRRVTNRLLREPLMASRLGEDLFKSFTANQMVNILQTIGRGMRNGCPVQVYFVDAAWAYNSTNSDKNKPDSGRNSMLVQMRIILEECVNHPNPVIREIYQELYGAFLTPLQDVRGVVYPKSFSVSEDFTETDEDEFDNFDEILEM
ncbi:MAG: hypothetical protein QNJ68_02215 [Microcoleaceae cyanobacterium MO_207.B10]|nr:hypothetical protein [Microcoleaceae cyanobacterium MO_207.B10]